MKIIIQTPTPNLKSSMEFYSTIGFEVKPTSVGAYALGGGHLNIEINTNRYSRAGLKLYAKNWDNIIDKMNPATIAKLDNGFLITSPEGCCVYLIEGEGPTTEYTTTKRTPVLGNFAGMSIETNLMNESVLFWEKFGFKKKAGNPEHGWVSLQNETGFGISLMKYQCCPHLFFNPSLTFFNGSENLNIIAKIRALRIPITEEITHFNKEGLVDNIIIRDPGGLGYFLFSD